MLFYFVLFSTCNFVSLTSLKQFKNIYVIQKCVHENQIIDSLRSNKLVTQIMHLNDDIWKDFGLNFISIVQVKLWHRKLGSEIHVWFK